MKDASIDRFPDAALPLTENALEDLVLLLESPGVPPSDERGSSIVAVGKRIVPTRARGIVRSGLTTLVRPWAARRARSMVGQDAVRLHLGSGRVYKQGWVNIDLAPEKVDLPWDLARGIPFPDDSVDAVFHEHLQEHLSLTHGLGLARESRRVLKPGGILRVAVPDAGEAVQSYAGNWADGWARSAPTGMIAIQRLFYEHGHRSMYDGQTLGLLLRAAGFEDIRRCRFGEGRLEPNVDTPARASGTLYMEAVK